MPTLRSHTHCQVAQKANAQPKLVKEYACPNAREKPTLTKQKLAHKMSVTD